MKNILTLIIIFTASLQLTAQSDYVSPSRETVENLLKTVDDCKSSITLLTEEISAMEKDPESFTLADYNNAKTILKQLQTCLSSSREKLDKLRKDYPGWFNNPSATVPLGKGHEITPRELENIFQSIEELISALLKDFGNLEEPK